jgi:hypothetical protein
MLKRSLEKGTTVERLKITQRNVFHRARNCVSGPEIPPQFQNFRPWTKFPGAGTLRNSAKSFTKRCGATLCKGAENFGLAEFLGARNIKNSFKSFTKGCGAACRKGPEILSNQNFRGPEILEFSALQIFAKSFLSSCGATFSKGPEFMAGIFRIKISRGPEFPAPGQNFRPQAGISALSETPEFLPPGQNFWGKSPLTDRVRAGL